MRVRLLAFASAADVLGDERVLEVADGSRVEDLERRLAVDFPTLAGLLPYVAWSVDGTLVARSSPLVEGCEVAVLPPVSGG